MRMILVKITFLLTATSIQCHPEDLVKKKGQEGLCTKNLLYLAYLHNSDHRVIDSVIDILNPSASHFEPTKFSPDNPIFDGHSIQQYSNPSQSSSVITPSSIRKTNASILTKLTWTLLLTINLGFSWYINLV